MFGMGFMEIFLILVVAVIALGPEKLPSAAVDIAKFFKKIKGGIDDAKSTLDSELNLSGLRDEANRIKSSVNIDRLSSLEFEHIMDPDDIPTNRDKIKKEINSQPKKEEV